MIPRHHLYADKTGLYSITRTGNLTNNKMTGITALMPGQADTIGSVRTTIPVARTGSL